ncbi:MAG: MarR family transcriptional regulator [Nanoarchaeota archaeon]|nr:MarR family transcriptional regulator [Nanoarchaeota archaeon]
MISFACKEIQLKDIIKCSFDLKKTDYIIFNFLMNSDSELSITDIAKKLKLERSGVQKAIQNLVVRELVLRRQVNLDNGGYQFFYSIKNKDEIKSRVEKIIDSWQRKAKEAVKDWA